MASDGGDKQKKINSEASFSGRSANEQPTGSSVWSLCSIPSDIHAVDLRDITPSLSPVFTEDQVRELSGQTGDLDVLGDSFLPHDTFKRITEVLSPEQTNLLISTCTSLCSESDMLSYSDPVVGSIGHFTSQHDPILNTPPEKTPTMNVLNQDSNKNKELNELGSKHVAKASKAAEPSTSKDNSVVTRPKNTDKNEKTEANEKEDSSADENKLKTKQIKSSYSLRSSPRKAANDERGTAETPSRNRRQRSKKETTNETERRKSPRGQKQSSEKEESPLSENKPHGKRGKQKQEPKPPEKPKEGEEKEEEKKEEGMNLRRLVKL